MNCNHRSGHRQWVFPFLLSTTLLSCDSTLPDITGTWILSETMCNGQKFTTSNYTYTQTIHEDDSNLTAVVTEGTTTCELAATYSLVASGDQYVVDTVNVTSCSPNPCKVTIEYELDASPGTTGSVEVPCSEGNFTPSEVIPAYTREAEFLLMQFMSGDVKCEYTFAPYDGADAS